MEFIKKESFCSVPMQRARQTRKWCGIRDVFAHQYTELNIEVAWNTIEDDIPVLEENVKDILKRMTDNMEG